MVYFKIPSETGMVMVIFWKIILQLLEIYECSIEWKPVLLTHKKKIKLKRIHIAILCFVPSLSVGFENREQNVKTFQMPFLAP